MKKLFPLIFILASQCVFAQSNDVNIHVSTTVDESARYEIIQSTLAARWTFRLDRVCGNIGQLVTTQNDGFAWQSMMIFGLPKCDGAEKNRYQLFISGLTAKNTFLMNTATGKTWRLATISGQKGVEVTAWFEFED